MRKYFLPTLFAIALVIWGYSRFNQKGPCEIPIRYAIGINDKRFSISNSDLLSATEEASQVWENTLGKNLFEYDTAYNSKVKMNIFQELMGRYFIRGDIIVNLIYDSRQKAADQNRQLVTSVNETKGSADAIKKQFLTLQNDYKRAVGEYEILLTQYKNGHGDRNTVETKRLEVNGLADQVNALVKKYNYLVTSVNSTIRTINQSAGHEFEEGQYVSDEKGERINIYEFGNRDALVRVLAHEFGHVLGLDHNDNPASIMYYLNSSKNIEPTKEDVAGLRAVCSFSH